MTTTEAAHLREIRKGLFPRRVWLSDPRCRTWGRLPFGKGSDEWGRHTVYLHIPWVIYVVVAYRWCACEDMEMFACEFPGCPARGCYSVPYEPTYCMTHHERFYRDWLDGEFDDEAEAA